MTDRYTGPRGWMDAETFRRVSCRGVWARDYGIGHGFELVALSGQGRGLNNDRWLWVGPHPDDTPDDDAAPDAGMVEIDAWVVVSVNHDGTGPKSRAEATQDSANTEAERLRSRRRLAKVVRLVGHTAPPAREAVETVMGVCDGE